jgi:2,3-bisphosphoglycerate-dependent phosphoglycerate mutase
MITNIYFVRHAHSTYTPDELSRPLSEKGFEAAKKVFEILAAEDITQVVSSPYKRAIQTVVGIAELRKLDVIIEEGFKERRLAEVPVENFEEAVVKAWEDFDFANPGGETGYCAQKRGVQALKDLLGKYYGGNVVIGTHGNIMVLIMNYFDKKFNYDFWCNLDMPDIYKLSFENEKLIEVRQLWEG